MDMMSSFDLSNRTALVTGSSRGIGRALALGLARAGADVAVHASRPSDRLDSAAETVSALGRRSAALAADLTDSAATAQLVDEAARALGAVDILVLNASIQIRRPWTEIPADEFARQIEANVHASLVLMQKAAPAMTDRGWGRILTVGSVQECRPHPEMAVYAASKSAQTALVRNLAKQLAPEGVTVNNLAPGVILTDRNTEALADDAYRAKVLEAVPASRFGESEDCVGAALLLCSDAGAYITGQNLYIDGGMGL